jgi:GntR family transcriptional repressor for pyruvate dehydrogenase complex
MTLFKKIQTPARMSEQIVEAIEEKILLGQLEPNTMLPSETELMKQFGVSRNTLREALRMLEASGIIAVSRGSQGGSTVTQVTNEFISDFLIKAIRLGGFSVDSLAQVRVALEPFIAERLATMAIDPEIVVKLEKNINDVRKLHEGGKLTGYGNMDFHVLLASATENPMFIIFLRTLRVIFYRITPKFIKERMQARTLDHHEIILEAIKKKDHKKARLQMHQHMLEMWEVMKEVDPRSIHLYKS